MKLGSITIILMLLQRFEVAIDLLNPLEVVVSSGRLLRTWG